MVISEPEYPKRRETEQFEHLRRAWLEGIESGDGGKLDFAELKRADRCEPPIPE